MPASSRPLTIAALLALGLTLSPPPAAAGLFDAVLDAAKEAAKTVGDGVAGATGGPGPAAPAALPPPFDFGSEARSQAAGYVETARASNFKEVKKVGIVNFSVEFALFKEASAVGGAIGGRGSTSTSSISMQIPPPDVARLQAIVDRLYRQVQQDFTAMGIEVVPFETLKATRNYAELAPAQHASPWLTETRDSQSVFIAPTGMPLYMDNPERADVLKQLGLTFGTNTRMKEVMMTYDLKQEVHLLSVNMVVDFASLGSSGSSRIFAARTSGASLHHLHAGNTSYRFVSTTQPEFVLVKLKKPVVSDRNLVADGSTTTERGGSIDGRTTETVTRSAGRFDSAAYYQRSEDMLQATRQMFTAALGATR